MDNFTINTIPKALKSLFGFASVIWSIVLVELCQTWRIINPLFLVFSLLTHAQILLKVRLMPWAKQGLFLFKVHFLWHQQLSSMNCVSFQEFPLMFKMGSKFVWDNACQWRCLGWKMLPPWMARLLISLSHLKDILTFMNYWFMNQLSRTCYALTLS